jgi:hypothetical protein
MIAGSTYIATLCTCYITLRLCATSHLNVDKDQAPCQVRVFIPANALQTRGAKWKVSKKPTTIYLFGKKGKGFNEISNLAGASLEI